MPLSTKQQHLLRKLPGVDHLLEMALEDPFFKEVPKTVVVNAIRAVLERQRHAILNDAADVDGEQLRDDRILLKVKSETRRAMATNLKTLVNATGVVVHTNLGRSLLAAEAVANMAEIAGRYSNLEYDLNAGKRGSRYSNVEPVLCEISGAQAAMVVNNNAGAVLLCLETLARDREVIVSRGELVEIGGSFRVPDVMAKSGGILHEVGTTNRTHLKDYARAIGERTALLLKVHRSNYSIVGFTAEVSLRELVELGASHGIPVMEDLGSGTFIDFARYGLQREPTVQESVAAGADVVTFSGDKLLGGPQAGIIVGKKHIIDRIKQNPLTRALRIDKLTLAALESTLRLYRDEKKALAAIPTLRMLITTVEEIAVKASRLATALEQIGDPRLAVEIIDRASRAGGGALPLLELPSKCLRVRVQGLSPNQLEQRLRANSPPIIGRIEDDAYLMDARTIMEDEFSLIAKAFQSILGKLSP